MGYNRNGIQVFVVPIPLGLLIFLLTLAVRSVKKRRPLKANRNCAVWLSLGVMFAVGAVLIFALIETTSNYQYVHSGWHILIALSLVFLLPYCQRDRRRAGLSPIPTPPSYSSQVSRLTEAGSFDWSSEDTPPVQNLSVRNLSSNQPGDSTC